MTREQIFYTLLSILIPVASLFVVLVYRHVTKKRIDATSIKYAIDHLPMGLAFFRTDGLTLLSNRLMQQLSERFAGQGLLNGSRFHHLLFEETDVTAGNVRGDADEFLLVTDSPVTLFHREETVIDSMRLTQFAAYGTKELYRKELELQEQLHALTEAANDLRDYQTQVDALAESEAYLAAKARIHDSLGQVLLSTRYYLTEDQPHITRQELLRAWKQTMDGLESFGETGFAWENAITGKKEDGGNALLRTLTDAADALGVSSHMEGTFPAENILLTRTILSAVRVSLINAVRHGRADEVKVIFSHQAPNDTDQGNHFVMRIENNGTVPGGKVREGGGLTNLRAQIEKEGGTLTYENAPRFAVVISLPYHEGEAQARVVE